MSVGRCLIITWIGKKGCAKTAGLSDTQLYKQAGNSVTVPVIKAIADRMGLEV